MPHGRLHQPAAQHTEEASALLQNLWIQIYTLPLLFNPFLTDPMSYLVIRVRQPKCIEKECFWYIVLTTQLFDWAIGTHFNQAYIAKRVQRGGSFLCEEKFCASYRPSGRMKAIPDTGLTHTGFRCVLSVKNVSKLSGI